MASAEAVAAVVEAGGAHVPRADGARSRSGWPSSPRSHGAVLAEHAGATIAAGGKRLRPLLVLRRRRAGAGGPRRACCARRWRSSSSTRPRSSTTTCSTPPRCAAAGRRWSPPPGARSRPPPATCCSRARSPSWRATGAPRRCACSRTRRRRSPQGELLQREDAWNAATSRASATCARCDLKTARLFEAACELGALERRRRRSTLLGEFGAPDRARVPAARRRARRLGPGRADRQAPRHRPARRHGHAAADPRARARPGAGRARPARGAHARAGRGGVRRDRRDGALEAARAEALGDGRRGEGRAAGAAGAPSAARWSWWPTAWSTATLA